MNKNILNKIIIEWNNSDIEDSGIIKASNIKSSIIYQLIYTVDKPRRIKIFNRDVVYFYEFKDKVYINGEHAELNERGFTVNEYEPDEYDVYIDRFDELNEISRYAFYNCTALTSIIIPNSVKTIGDSAFSYCTSLTSTTIPNSAEWIGYDAFFGCTSLTSITIPNSVEWIGYDAFFNCISLKTVYVEDINKFNEIEFGNEYSNPTAYGAKLIKIGKYK